MRLPSECLEKPPPKKKQYKNICSCLFVNFVHLYNWFGSGLFNWETIPGKMYYSVQLGGGHMLFRPCDTQITGPLQQCLEATSTTPTNDAGNVTKICYACMYWKWKQGMLFLFLLWFVLSPSNIQSNSWLCAQGSL